MAFTLQQQQSIACYFNANPDSTRNLLGLC